MPNDSNNDPLPAPLLGATPPASREDAAREALHREYPWTQFVDDREMVAAVLADNPEGVPVTLEKEQTTAPSIREPRCVHPGGGAASTCPVCKDDPPLREWKRAWATWLAANPDSDEARNGYARWVRDR